MYHTPSKLLLAAAMTMLVTTDAVLADREIVNIDHPNGRPTYIAKPLQRATTVAVYTKEQGLTSDEAVNNRRSEKRTVRIQLGRGQYIPVHSGGR